MKKIITATKKEQIIEDLANLEHEQWWGWAESLMEKEDLSEEREKRWEEFFVPYDELSEEIKDSDREYAKKAYEIMEKYFKENSDE